MAIRALIFTLTLLLWLPITVYAASADNSKSSPVPTLQDFTRLAIVIDIKIAPDGRHLAVTFRTQGKVMLSVLETESLKPVGFFDVKGDGGHIDEVY